MEISLLIYYSGTAEKGIEMIIQVKINNPSNILSIGDVEFSLVYKTKTLGKVVTKDLKLSIGETLHT